MFGRAGEMRWVTIFFFKEWLSMSNAYGKCFPRMWSVVLLSDPLSLSLYLYVSLSIYPSLLHSLIILHCFTSAVQFLSAPPPTPLLLLLLSIALSSACLDSLHSLFCLHSYVIHSSRDPYPPAAVVWNRSVHASEPTLTQGGWKPLIFSYSRG